MKGLAIVFDLAGIVLVTGALAAAAWGGMPPGLGVLWILFADADPLVKLVMLLQVPLLLALLVIGALELTRKPPRGRSDALSGLAYTAAGAGLLAALYGSINIVLAMQATGIRDPRVIAPSAAEMMLVAGLGLLVGSLGLLLNGAAGARAKA